MTPNRTGRHVDYLEMIYEGGRAFAHRQQRTLQYGASLTGYRIRQIVRLAMSAPAYVSPAFTPLAILRVICCTQ
jgi:hypothetical protein